MINLRNLGEFPITLQIKGTLTTTANNAQAYAISQPLPFNATLGAVWAMEARPGSSAAGTPGDCIDLQYLPASTTVTQAATLLTSGVMFNFASSTISSAGYGLIPNTLTATATAGGYNTGFTTTVGNPPVFARGGILSVVAKTVASTPGADLTVVVTLNRARQGAGIDPVAVGTYDPDSDIF
jgi:hypothetical protein